MNIQIQIDPADYTQFVRHVTCACSDARYGRKLARFLYALLIGLAAGFFASRAGVGLHFFSILIGAAAGVFWLYTLVKFQMRGLHPSPDGMIRTPQELQISPDGVRVRARHFELFYRWEAVKSIDETSEHIFIMVDRIAGFIVPKRVFASKTEPDEFLRQSREFAARRCT